MSKKKITYEEFIERFAKTYGKSEKEVREFVDSCNESIRKGLLRDGNVRLSSFGQIELRRSSERKGRNPQTGEEITIPAQTRADFKPGKKLADAVNQDFAHLEAEVLKEEPVKESEEIEPISVFKRGVFKPSTNRPEYKVAATMTTTAILIALLFFFLLRPDPVLIVEEPVEVPEQIEPKEEVVVVEDMSEKILPKDFEHIVSFNEKLWTIADKYYESHYWWPVIYQRNEETIPHPDFIRENMKVYVPNIAQRQNRDRLIAQAYLNLYHFYRKDFNDAARDFLFAARTFDKDVVESSSIEIPQEDMAYAIRR